MKKFSFLSEHSIRMPLVAISSLIKLLNGSVNPIWSDWKVRRVFSVENHAYFARLNMGTHR